MFYVQSAAILLVAGVGGFCLFQHQYPLAGLLGFVGLVNLVLLPSNYRRLRARSNARGQA